MQVTPLAGSHDRQAFDCGRQELNVWLRQVARQHYYKWLSKTCVADREEARTSEQWVLRNLKRVRFRKSRSADCRLLHPVLQ